MLLTYWPAADLSIFTTQYSACYTKTKYASYAWNVHPAAQRADQTRKNGKSTVSAPVTAYSTIHRMVPDVFNVVLSSTLDQVNDIPDMRVIIVSLKFRCWPNIGFVLINSYFTCLDVTFSLEVFLGTDVTSLIPNNFPRSYKQIQRSNNQTHSCCTVNVSRRNTGILFGGEWSIDCEEINWMQSFCIKAVHGYSRVSRPSSSHKIRHEARQNSPGIFVDFHYRLPGSVLQPLYKSYVIRRF